MSENDRAPDLIRNSNPKTRSSLASIDLSRVESWYFGDLGASNLLDLLYQTFAVLVLKAKDEFY